MYPVQLLEVNDAKQHGMVDCTHMKKRIFLVMNSVFPAEASSFVTERFDLKGSTVGRECSLAEQRAKGANAVLKDINLKLEVETDRLNQKHPCGLWNIGLSKVSQGRVKQQRMALSTSSLNSLNGAAYRVTFISYSHQ